MSRLASLGRLVAELVWLLLSTAWLLVVAAQESGVRQALWGIALVVNAVVMGARVRSAAGSAGSVRAGR